MRARGFYVRATQQADGRLTPWSLVNYLLPVQATNRHLYHSHGDAGAPTYRLLNTHTPRFVNSVLKGAVEAGRRRRRDNDTAGRDVAGLVA